MEFDIKTIGLIGGAVAVMFWPQISSFLGGLKAKAASPAPRPAGPQSRSVGSEPADWVVDLFALQNVLLANNRNDAADLVSQAIVKIVGSTSTKQNGGARK